MIILSLLIGAIFPIVPSWHEKCSALQFCHLPVPREWGEFPGIFPSISNILKKELPQKWDPYYFFCLSVCEERRGSPCPRSGEEKNTENLQAFLAKYVTKILAPLVYKRDFGVHIPGMFSRGVSWEVKKCCWLFTCEEYTDEGEIKLEAKNFKIQTTMECKEKLPYWEATRAVEQLLDTSLVMWSVCGL